MYISYKQIISLNALFYWIMKDFAGIATIEYVM